MFLFKNFTTSDFNSANSRKGIGNKIEKPMLCIFLLRKAWKCVNRSCCQNANSSVLMFLTAGSNRLCNWPLMVHCRTIHKIEHGHRSPKAKICDFIFYWNMISGKVHGIVVLPCANPSKFALGHLPKLWWIFLTGNWSTVTYKNSNFLPNPHIILQSTTNSILAIYRQKSTPGLQNL